MFACIARLVGGGEDGRAAATPHLPAAGSRDGEAGGQPAPPSFGRASCGEATDSAACARAMLKAAASPHGVAQLAACAASKPGLLAYAKPGNLNTVWWVCMQTRHAKRALVWAVTMGDPPSRPCSDAMGGIIPTPS